MTSFSLEILLPFPNSNDLSSCTKQFSDYLPEKEEQSFSLAPTYENGVSNYLKSIKNKVTCLSSIPMGPSTNNFFHAFNRFCLLSKTPPHPHPSPVLKGYQPG